MRLSLINNLLIAATALSIVGCGKDFNTQKPIGSSSAVPKQVTGISVRNGSGKSVISYVVPNDSVLLYVKAEYTLSTGKKAEVKASYFSDSLVVDGFADINEHEVKLYSVSRSEVKSEPITVKIKPEESPIWKVYKSIDVQTAFGGYNLTAVNKDLADISINVLRPNAVKEYEIDINKSIYTNVDAIISKVRGLDTLDYTYGFVVTDKWGNATDTLYKTFKPLYETEFSKSKFSALVLPGDAPQVTNGAAWNYAWDGKLGWPNTSFTNQSTGGTGPHMLTLDLGTTGKISRVWIRPFPEGTRFYYLSTMRRFEIWGATSPNLNGALDNSWTLLGSYEVIKPSGLPYGTDNTADQTEAAAGFNWEVDLSAPKVKYLRIRCLENWAGGTAQSINELSVYGDPR
jgi:hypothetical protein